jgi:hypothetical protein
MADAMDGRRDEKTREVIASYVDEIRIYPEYKTGEMVLNTAAFPLVEVGEKESDRPEGQSRVDMVAGARYTLCTPYEERLIFRFRCDRRSIEELA